MIKILTFSDIHNNISAVQSLRDQETNEYDAIVIAGDIGNYIWPEILAIIDTFECPAYFVYGNWDSRQPYIRQLSSNGILLNHTIEFHKGYYFTGFSGCETHWGMNPLLTEQVDFINFTYQSEIEAHKKEQVDAKMRMDNLIQKVSSTYLKNRRNVKKAANKKDTKRFNNEVFELRNWKAIELNKIASQTIDIVASSDYEKYRQEIHAAQNKTLFLNRNKLFTAIRQSNIPNNRLIIISHDRLTKISKEKIPAALHIFGHRHDYKLTKMGTSHYLNTAQLDSSIDMESRSKLGGGYCIVKLDGDSISVERRTLPFFWVAKQGPVISNHNHQTISILNEF